MTSRGFLSGGLAEPPAASADSLVARPRHAGNLGARVRPSATAGLRMQASRRDLRMVGCASRSEPHKQEPRGNAMLGLMQDWPLLCHRIIDHAAINHAERPIVTRSIEG